MIKTMVLDLGPGIGTDDCAAFRLHRRPTVLRSGMWMDARVLETWITTCVFEVSR